MKNKHVIKLAIAAKANSCPANRKTNLARREGRKKSLPYSLNVAGFP